jgi:hypothetical protein
MNHAWTSSAKASFPALRASDTGHHGHSRLRVDVGKAFQQLVIHPPAIRYLQRLKSHYLTSYITKYGDELNDKLFTSIRAWLDRLENIRSVCKTHSGSLGGMVSIMDRIIPKMSPHAIQKAGCRWQSCAGTLVEASESREACEKPQLVGFGVARRGKSKKDLHK